jgi:hypothetical protein
MQNTLKTPASFESPRDTIDRVGPTKWEIASDIVTGFTHDPAFLEFCINNNVDPDDNTKIDHANALSLYAEQFSAENSDGSIEGSVLDQVTLIANTPYYLHVQKEMTFYHKEMEKRWLNGDEMAYLDGFKPYVVWYNQKISDFMYQHPEGKMSTIKRALIEQSLDAFPRESHMVEREVSHVTHGARTEAATRQLLDRTDLEYDAGTPEDDLKGGDLIMIRNGKRIKVDIKSSLTAIAKLRGGYDQIEAKKITFAISKSKRDKNKLEHVIVLFPGFTDSDFGDSLYLTIPEKDIQNRALFIAKQLALAFQELRV